MTPNEIVESYLEQSLRLKLLQYGVSPAFLQTMFAVVRRQMLSAIRCHNDDAFWKTLQLIVSEEAPFYQPNAPLDIKSFVVLTLRNSPFETLQSDFYAETGLKKSLEKEQVISVTADAIRYFTQNNPFVAVSQKEADDYYRQLANAYPVAWNALSVLANATDTIVNFVPVTRSDATAFADNIRKLRALDMGKQTVVKDGFSDEVEPQLAHYLQSLAENRGCFFCDCFKMVSRNPKLLLLVLEFLLINDCSFVSVNYRICNGRVERRKNILKAAHGTKDMLQQLRNLNGISPDFRRILLSIREQVK